MIFGAGCVSQSGGWQLRTRAGNVPARGLTAGQGDCHPRFFRTARQVRSPAIAFRIARLEESIDRPLRPEVEPGDIFWRGVVACDGEESVSNPRHSVGVHEADAIRLELREDLVIVVSHEQGERRRAPQRPVEDTDHASPAGSDQPRRVRRLSRSSSRNTYGIGLPWFVRLAAYASSAERSSARAAAVERLTGRCLCRLTTPRAFKTLFHKIMGSFGLSGAGWVGVDIATTVP